MICEWFQGRHKVYGVHCFLVVGGRLASTNHEISRGWIGDSWPEFLAQRELDGWKFLPMTARTV